MPRPENAHGEQEQDKAKRGSRGGEGRAKNHPLGDQMPELTQDRPRLRGLRGRHGQAVEDALEKSRRRLVRRQGTQSAVDLL